MKQLLQSLRSGRIELQETPCPAVGHGQVLIRSRASLVSPGTERMLLAFGKAGWIDKARQQPDKVRLALDKARTDGLVPTVAAIRSRLEQPLEMGYCNAGIVMAVADDVTDFSVGDRVVSNGRHAEVVAVPKNLCARIPPSVADDVATFAVPGAIALHGVRLAQPTLGETVAVIGLGLIGLLAIQLLRAHGCAVIAIDRDSSRVALARALGATAAIDTSGGDDGVGLAHGLTAGRGVDAGGLAAATDSNEPLHHAARMCRKRARIVLIGSVGLQLSRADFYEKELTFQVSCSYGPGRYDPLYEDAGYDYPAPFVRWTAGRNFEAVLAMLAERRIETSRLVSHRYPFGEAERAFEVLAGAERSLGIVLEYPDEPARTESELRRRTLDLPIRALERQRSDAVAVGVIGAGNHVRATLVPALDAAGANFEVVSSQKGLNAMLLARKHGFARVTTENATVFDDHGIEAIVIATPHHSHADLVCQAIRARKHVFVEKPLALTRDGLEAIETAVAEARRSGRAPLLMVGFNRRFAPMVQRMKALLGTLDAPKTFVMTVNAGAVASTHWVSDVRTGGSRIVGEGCHFIDLLRFLADAPIVDVDAMPMHSRSGSPDDRSTATFSMAFADGSLGTVLYLANGHRAYPKERLEVFCGGRVLELDNFRTLTGYGWPAFRRERAWVQDKGHKRCIAAFIRAVETHGPPPIPFAELVEVTRTSFDVRERLAEASGVAAGS